MAPAAGHCGGTPLATLQPRRGDLRGSRGQDFQLERTERQWDELRRQVETAGAVLAHHARLATGRASLLRLLGAALIIYGAIGLAATLYGHSLISQAFAGARQVSSQAPAEKARALGGLQSIAATLDDASTSASNVSGSFGQSQASLTTASGVAADVAGAFREVARYSQVQLFGIQPIAGMAQPFLDSSQQLDGLSADLARTSTAVGANATDMRRMSADFARLKVEVQDLSLSVARLPTDPFSGDGARRLETALNAMLVWIGLQGLASLFAGLAIILAPLRRPKPPSA